jgi:iron complex outermembrane recepter protein
MIHSTLKLRLALMATTAFMAVPVFASVYAQEAPAADKPAAEESQTVIITGTRRSLTDALATKRRSTEIIDSISSEGIGRLPDLNVAEALQRVPGVQINRSAERRQGTVSIRGLTAPFVLTQINGQALATPFASSVFPFGTLRSEVFNNIDVVKAQDASNMTGGLAGIVNLKTTSPLRAKNSLSLTVNQRFEELTGAYTPGGALVFTRQLIPNVLAVRGAFGIQKLDYREDALRVNSFFRIAGAATPTTSDDILTPQNIRLVSNRTKGDNTSGSLAFSWKPNDNFNGEFDAFFAEMTPDAYQVFDQIDVRSGFTTVTGTGTLLDLGPAGKVWSGVRMVNPVLITDSRQQTEDQKTEAYTVKGTWKNENWTLEAVAHTTNASILSQTTGGLTNSGATSTGAIAEFESGKGKFSNATYDVTGASYNFFNFAQPMSTPVVGTNFRVVNPTGAGLTTQAFNMSYRYQTRTDEEQSLRFDITRNLNLGIFRDIKFGVMKREKEQTATQAIGTFLNAKLSNLDNSIYLTNNLGDGALLGGAGRINAGTLWQWDVRRMQEMLTRGGLSTTGAQAASTVAPTPTNPTGVIYAQDRFFIGPDGLVQLIDGQALNAHYMNSETITGYYIMTNLDYDLQWAQLRGNIGVRHEKTERSTLAQRRTTPIKLESDHTLPNINLSLDFNNDFVLRTSYTKTLRRPETDQFAVARALSTDAIGRLVTINIGAPDLKPFTSTNLDIAAEWYNRPGSSVSLGYFAKTVEDYAASQAICPADGGGFGFGTLQRVGGVCQTTAVVPAQSNADGNFVAVEAGAPVNITIQANQDTFKLNGLEFNVQQDLRFLDNPLKYLGGQFNYTYVKFRTVGNFRLSELSPHTYNAIAYYETPLFGLRAAYVYRAGYGLDQGGTNQGAASRSTGRSQVDASAYYNITPKLQVTLEAFNLTNQPIYQYQGIEDRSRAYIEYGKTFTVGLKYQFQ